MEYELILEVAILLEVAICQENFQTDSSSYQPTGAPRCSTKTSPENEVNVGKQLPPGQKSSDDWGFWFGNSKSLMVLHMAVCQNLVSL